MKVLATLLPERVVCEEIRSGGSGVGPAGPGASPDLSSLPVDTLGLFPQEEAVVARAVDKRRREFAVVRGCARRALARLGHPPVAILPGERGQPSWPDGIVGSMTHCAGYAAAAVASSAGTAAVGIDAEPNEALPDGVLGVIALPAERAWIQELGRDRPEVCWDRLLFSAKESVYKAWFPLAGQWLGFEDARIDVDPAAETFSARLAVPGPVVDGRRLAGFTGRWAVFDGLVVTSIAVPGNGVTG